MNNEQEFNVIAQVVNAHLCNKQDRLVLDQAMQTLAKLVQATVDGTTSASELPLK